MIARPGRRIVHAAPRGVELWDSGAWSAFLSGWGKANMAGKDKGGRASKTPAAKSAKEKRQAKKNKKAGNSNPI